jgi:hypothetical protein
MKQNKKQSLWLLVCRQTILTEWTTLVGEVSANCCGYTGVTWSAQRVPMGTNFSFLDHSRYFLKH